MAGWSSLTGAVIGVGVGEAAGAAISPVLEPERQAAWKQSQVRLLELGVLARLVATGLIDIDAAAGEAELQGFTRERLEARVQLELVAAPVAELLELWRRGKIGERLVDHGLAKAGIEPDYWEPLKELFFGRLDAPVVAEAIQRGIMADPGFLPVGPPTGTGKVPAFPRSPLDPLEEAQAHGIDRERLFVETALIGNPMSPEEAAQAVFRDIIERVDYDRAIAEGRTRNEWGDAILEHARQIPTATDYVAARLRAWIDDAGLAAGAARHGMSPADAELLLKIHGRPLSWHQVWIGLQRGGTYNGPTDIIDPAFLKALEESDIRPEWYNLAWHQRYNYPSPFVLRSMTQAGDITQAEADQILRFIGWEPTLAAKVSQRWAAGTGAAGRSETKAELLDEYAGGYITEAELRSSLASLGYSGAELELEVHLGDARRVKRYREKVIDAIAAGYLAFKVDDATAATELGEVGVTGEAATLLLDLWQKGRRDTIRTLTTTQVAKAYKDGVIDQATALDQLEALHLTAADARELLGLPAA